MAILSPIMSYIVDKEVGFPIPSEKEKINKALKRYRYLLSSHPKRSDAPEIMFGIADLLVGRNEPGDYSEATKLYDQILMRPIPDYLKGRTLIGKAELLIGHPYEVDNAISLCEKARQLLGSDIADFFAAKTYIVEAELRLSRRNKSDWEQALGLINHVVKEKQAHWYFKGRALMAKAEILFYQEPANLIPALKLTEEALKEFKSRPNDYFAVKGKVLKAEMLSRRAQKADLGRAEKLFTDVIKSKCSYKELIARSKIGLANIVNHPEAAKLLKSVHQMEGVDPYLAEKASLIEQHLKSKKAAKAAPQKAKKAAKAGKKKKRK